MRGALAWRMLDSASPSRFGVLMTSVATVGIRAGAWSAWH